MSTWNAVEMEQAAKNNTTVPPQYLNLQDAFLHPFPPHPNSRGTKPPTQFQFALNSAGMNRILFCAPSLQSLTVSFFKFHHSLLFPSQLTKNRVCVCVCVCVF